MKWLVRRQRFTAGEPGGLRKRTEPARNCGPALFVFGLDGSAPSWHRSVVRRVKQKSVWFPRSAWELPGATLWVATSHSGRRFGPSTQSVGSRVPTQSMGTRIAKKRLVPTLCVGTAWGDALGRDVT